VNFFLAGLGLPMEDAGYYLQNPMGQTSFAKNLPLQ